MRRGFTLIELLVVLVIIGVMALVIGPSFTTGSDMTRVKTASRGVMQMSRYARTMAVLYQAPMVLIVSSDGTLSVEQGGKKGGGGVAAAETQPLPEGTRSANQASVPSAESTFEEDGGASYNMADLNAQKKYEQIRFMVTLDEELLTSDEIETQLKEETATAESAGEEDRQVMHIPFESNGRCLPFTVRVQAAGTEDADFLIVRVDRFGSARVEEDVLR